MKKIAVALTIAAAIAAAPAYAGKCPSEVARNGGDVSAFVAYYTLSFFGGTRIFGAYCRPS